MCPPGPFFSARRLLDDGLQRRLDLIRRHAGALQAGRRIGQQRIDVDDVARAMRSTGAAGGVVLAVGDGGRRRFEPVRLGLAQDETRRHKGHEDHQIRDNQNGFGDPVTLVTLCRREPWPCARSYLKRSSKAFLALDWLRGIRGGLGLALDGGPRLEDARTRCARPSGETRAGTGLLALERRARVEVRALRAAVQVGLAPRALAGRAPRRRDGELVAAARALHDFPEPGHV